MQKGEEPYMDLLRPHLTPRPRPLGPPGAKLGEVNLAQTDGDEKQVKDEVRKTASLFCLSSFLREIYSVVQS